MIDMSNMDLINWTVDLVVLNEITFFIFLHSIDGR